MAEASGDDDREIEASEEKIRRATERGDLPVSSDFWLLGSLLAIDIALAIVPSVTNPARVLRLGELLQQSGVVRLEELTDVAALLVSTIGMTAPSWGAIILCLGAVPLFVGSLPQPPRLSWARLAPEPGRLDPIKGFGRLFGAKGFRSFLKTIVKSLMATAAAAAVGALELSRILSQANRDAAAGGADTLGVAIRAAHAITAVVAAFAILDLVSTRLAWRKRLRMSRQEAKDERRQSEGDPLVKMRMRSIALDRARKRMLTDVASATMVISNPTHYAVALRYVREEGGAPTVVAKGQELLALRIRGEAGAREIPIVEQPELARAMYRSVDIGREIPIEFYRAVAEIVNFLALRKSASGSAE